MFSSRDVPCRIGDVAADAGVMSLRRRKATISMRVLKTFATRAERAPSSHAGSVWEAGGSMTKEESEE